MKLLLFSLLLPCCQYAAAQYRLHGKITNTRLEPLAFASMQLKGSRTGILTKEDGSYSFEVNSGIYEVIVSMIGYRTRSIKVVVNKQSIEHSIIMEEMDNNLSNVTVISRSKDKAEEYIRQVIRNKDAIQSASGAFSCNVYIKAVQEDSITSKKRKKKEIIKDSINRKPLPPPLSMSEIYLRLDYESATRFKEERTGVTKRGNTSNLFYLSTTQGRFNFYDNLVKVPALSVTPFLSPISYSGLLAYKYKTLKIEKKGNHHIYTIGIKPGSLSNATVTGEIVIDDSAWVILKTKLSFPKYHLPEYDFFEVEQSYDFVDNAAWMLTKQVFTYYSNTKKRKAFGTTSVTFKDFELNKKFDKKYFGPEVSAATREAYLRDSTFWSSVRTEPLSEKEVKLIQYTDSVRAVINSKAYKDSIDKVTNKANWKNILYKGQTLSYHEKGIRYILPSMASTIAFSFGGFRTQLPLMFYKTDSLRKTISLNTNISYGYLNRDINGSIRLTRKYNPFNQGSYSINFTRDFVAIFSGDAWINQLKRSNYYLDNAIGGGWSREIINGLFIKANFSMSLRRSLADYKTYSIVDSAFQEVLQEPTGNAPSFEPYNALYGDVEISYTPFQPYIREPLEKIILEPKWPTFYTQWRKGIPRLLGSDVNFDYNEFGIRQHLRMGLVGNAQYTIKTGSFLNTKDVRLIDYKWQRRGDPILFMNPNEAFQSMDSTFAVFKRFYEGHYFHEFNGAILNKIPLFKKIGLREVAGAGFLIAPERNLRYAEAFAGVERVFKLPFQNFQKVKIGVYASSAFANQFQSPLQFKIGITSWDTFGNRWR
ncbi:DUF5686 and carboxypeptidase regulatory-like domain-containing protein [Niabella ginsengisoli]|uniref:DUF5686 and carboxypeptidase regulatory-like domain-containing protein n=1 Tax=Niabella ginsengisoli TaxID=522298 RepID=A0ABS9SF47_9BACT|nr:DUF5686 and carboxypeptidase regulatory-like domain-containing protein [Niabella ginsengisoli]MCH5596986.1 DUF5686 and carboxypeptidase regulatory-like domain-containing protein [Niabella ginsengisoli]